MIIQKTLETTLENNRSVGAHLYNTMRGVNLSAFKLLALKVLSHDHVSYFFNKLAKCSDLGCAVWKNLLIHYMMQQLVGRYYKRSYIM